MNNKSALTLSKGLQIPVLGFGTWLPQLCIRYVLQKEFVVLPKSIHPEYIQKNRDVDFEISAGDMQYLDSMKDTTKRIYGTGKSN